MNLDCENGDLTKDESELGIILIKIKNFQLGFMIVFINQKDPNSRQKARRIRTFNPKCPHSEMIGKL